ncbi:retrovirus-related pol polyprotein from transposon TNT 1-94 [Tanacetum coccineum]
MAPYTNGVCTVKCRICNKVGYLTGIAEHGPADECKPAIGYVIVMPVERKGHSKLMNNDSLRSEWRKVFHPPRFYQDLKKFYWLSSRGVVLKISRRVKGGSRGTDLYSYSSKVNSPNPICLMAKATSSQAWLWHRRLSHLNFDTINLLSKIIL